MTSALTHRVARVELRLSVSRPAPCFILASDHRAAARQIAQLAANRLPRTLFVMLCPSAEERQP